MSVETGFIITCAVIALGAIAIAWSITFLVNRGWIAPPKETLKCPPCRVATEEKESENAETFWTTLKRRFELRFRRAWRLWWGLWAAPFLGTYREAAKVIREYFDESRRRQ